MSAETVQPSAFSEISPTAQPLRIAFLGTGLMGLPMARRLCQAGHHVHVWNRTAARAQALTAFGAVLHATARAACAQADVVVSMLENGPVTQAVLFDGPDAAAAGLCAGALVVDMASIQPQEARAHAARLAGQGVRHLDAPVSGGTVGAEAGTLAIMVGGEPQDFEAVAAVFAALGRATHVGPCGAGQLAKLANQMIVGITIGAVAEALHLCARGGADVARVREAITGGFADSRILQLHGQRMVQRSFAPGARMTVQHKDLSNALHTAADTGTALPITALLTQLYANAIDHGLRDLDHSALLLEIEGLQPPH